MMSNILNSKREGTLQVVQQKSNDSFEEYFLFKFQENVVDNFWRFFQQSFHIQHQLSACCLINDHCFQAHIFRVLDMAWYNFQLK